MVFKGKKKKNAAGVWEDCETAIDAWPEVLFIKPRSWAADEDLIKPGATLVSINGVEAPATFKLAKEMLKAGADECTAANPFIELVWRAGAEEAVPPGDISMSVRKWAVLMWNPHWIKFSGGLLSLYKCSTEPTADTLPIIEARADEPGMELIADEMQSERARLVTGAAEIHLKFLSSEQRQLLLDAVETALDTAPGTEITIDQTRYPFQIEKYWLGPMDPTKQASKDDHKGGTYAHATLGGVQVGFKLRVNRWFIIL